MSPADKSHLLDADRELIASGLRKRQRSEALTAKEIAAIRRFEQAREEADRWRYYASVPKRHYAQLSGRQTKTLNEQASRYGVPIHGSLIDLGQVIRWLHDFLAKHGRKLLAEDTDPLMGGGNSPALEEYRREKAKLARLDRQQREETLVDRETAHLAFQRVASLLQQAGEALQKEFGPDAGKILNETLRNCQREVDSVFGYGPESRA
jgi:hypothetical protein